MRFWRIFKFKVPTIPEKVQEKEYVVAVVAVIEKLNVFVELAAEDIPGIVGLETNDKVEVVVKGSPSWSFNVAVIEKINRTLGVLVLELRVIEYRLGEIIVKVVKADVTPDNEAVSV